MGERVISEQAARELTYMMTQVVETRHRRAARGWTTAQVAGKTGTTQARPRCLVRRLLRRLCGRRLDGLRRQHAR